MCAIVYALDFVYDYSFTGLGKESVQVVKNRRFLWPKFKPEEDNTERLDSEEASSDNLPVYVHDTNKGYKVRTKMSFSIFTRTTDDNSSEKESASVGESSEVKVKPGPLQLQKLLPKVSNIPQEGSQQELLSVAIEHDY